MSWVWITLGVVALVALPFTGMTGRLTAIGVSAVVCVSASYVGWQMHGVSPLYPVVMLASGAYCSRSTCPHAAATCPTPA